MTWDAYHRRKTSLRELLALADRDRAATLGDLLETVDPQRAVFTDDTAALFELQMTWFQRLNGTVERLATEGAESPEMVALAAWVQTAAELPAVRRLLDDAHDVPALRRARATEKAFIAAWAGVPAGDGERIIAEARATAPTDVRGTDRPAERPGLIARLRSAIAA